MSLLRLSPLGRSFTSWSLFSFSLCQWLFVFFLFYFTTDLTFPLQEFQLQRQDDGYLEVIGLTTGTLVSATWCPLEIIFPFKTSFPPKLIFSRLIFHMVAERPRAVCLTGQLHRPVWKCNASCNLFGLRELRIGILRSSRRLERKPRSKFASSKFVHLFRRYVNLFNFWKLAELRWNWILEVRCQSYRKEISNSRLCVHLQVLCKTWEMVISRRWFAENGKEMYGNKKGTCKRACKAFSIFH